MRSRKPNAAPAASGAQATVETSMKICDRCFAEIEVDAEFCTECGARIDGSDAGAVDAAVYPQLAKANLLRMRGNHAEAERLCLAVLKQFPYNSTAHILLGDIHADKGNSREALDWYELAVELEPENASLKAKRDRIRKEREKEEAVAAAVALEVPTSNARTVLLSSAIVVVLIAIIVGAYFVGKQRAGSDVNLDDLIRPVSIGENAPPQPDPATKEPEQTERPENPSPEPNTQPPIAMTAEELRIKRDAAAMLGPLANHLLHVELDFRDGSARVTAAAVDDKLLVDAAKIGAAILFVTENANRVHVRMIDTSIGSLRLAGTVNRDSLAAAQALQEGSPEWAAAVIFDLVQR